MRVRQVYLCRSCGKPAFIDQLHLHDPDLRTIELAAFNPGDCRRLDAHDHPDPALPDWFHAWLRGERRRAPALRSWWSQRNIDEDMSEYSAESGSSWHDTNAGLFAA